LRLLLLAVCVAVAACANKQTPGPQMVEGQLPVGTVELHGAQAAYIGSATGGTGTLFFRGIAYKFDIGGLGIGGIGASTIDAQGDVYALQQPWQFAGAYAQGRYGVALGDLSTGDLWLKNDNGVILHLKAKRTGLMLSLGGDAMVVTMN
jgi:hypothetical protein